MSGAETMRRYLSERYPSRRFVPLALLLAGAGMLSVPGAEHLSTAAALRAGLRASLVAYLIILSLRVWDDLEDRERDAPAHPDRVTVRVASATPLRYLQWASAATASVLIATGTQPATRLLVLSLLVAALGIWYRARAWLAPAAVVTAHVVLLKYPVSAYLVAPGVVRGVRGLVLAAPVLVTVYLLLCIHEGLDDPELRRSRAARDVLVAEAGLILPLLALVVVSMLEPLRVLAFDRGSLP